MGFGSRQPVELLANLLPRRNELAGNFLPFVVLRRSLVSGQITQVHRHVPFQRQTALIATPFTLANRIGETLSFVMLQVRADMGI